MFGRRHPQDARHFQEIVGECQDSKLQVNLIQPSKMESTERQIALEIPKNCLHFDFPKGVDLF